MQNQLSYLASIIVSAITHQFLADIHSQQYVKYCCLKKQPYCYSLYLYITFFVALSNKFMYVLTWSWQKPAHFSYNNMFAWICTIFSINNWLYVPWKQKTLRKSHKLNIMYLHKHCSCDAAVLYLVTSFVFNYFPLSLKTGPDSFKRLVHKTTHKTTS